MLNLNNISSDTTAIYRSPYDSSDSSDSSKMLQQISYVDNTQNKRAGNISGSNVLTAAATSQPRLDPNLFPDSLSEIVSSAHVNEPSESEASYKKSITEHLLPGIYKFIEGALNDLSLEMRSYLDNILSDEDPLHLSDDLKNTLTDKKQQISAALNKNDLKEVSRLIKEAESCLSNVGANFSSTGRKFLSLALQGIKVRQPLAMGQLPFYTTKAFGTNGEAKLAIQVNLVPPSVFDKILGTNSNNEVHLQIFLHNELAVSKKISDFGENCGLSCYGGLISHDGIDLTLKKADGKWQYSSPQLVNEFVVRAESDPSWNSKNDNGTANCQFTLGSDYVSQRFYACDASGVTRFMAQTMPKWITGTGVMAAGSLLGCATPIRMGMAATAFQVVNMLTKYASEYVPCMKPDKEFRIVELMTISSPLDGGYTNNSGVGFRAMLRMNGGIGVLKNNANLTEDDEISRERVTPMQLPDGQRTSSESLNAMELRQRRVSDSNNV